MVNVEKGALLSEFEVHPSVDLEKEGLEEDGDNMALVIDYSDHNIE